MTPLRIAAIVLVIGAGLAGSYWIIKSSVPSVVSENNSGSPSSIASSASSGTIPIQWINKIGSSIAENYAHDGFQTTGDSSKSANAGKSATPNLTESFAKSLFSEMRLRDQSGSKPFQNFNPNDPEAKQLIAEAAVNIGPGNFFQQTVDEKDLKISSDNSKSSKLKYLGDIGQISKSRFSDKKYQRSSDQIIADINKDCFGNGTSLNQGLADIYKNLADDYLNLAAPSDWLSLHKQIIEHFKNSEEIYQSFADCSKDPIRSYLATQALPQLMDKAQAIQNLIVQKYKEVTSQ